MVADVNTGATSVLASGYNLPPDWNPNGGIEWSPDGTRIAIWGGSPAQAIWIVEVGSAPVPAIRTTWGRIKADRR
jgi:hypothetical protein